ncbi:uncharacterized protein LOC105436902 isoform X1 [Strongylocentrotus purpuratus]|uniref:HTH CENPB-type domain-containing protein n=1 Tax=Strongylocentrotus purpuratus TaxID=7668 RepID=A0A7M7T3F6_STRPU|nr:uncharacterized protein LOC105436902 isoform X1 [Strongylocentrotus purpuratus]XP_030851046.1 uncharacterized protein LOC105436902 isoform X1 [Strongylocentrotus purpuratus]XP_030851047.1 uncharacterized protein LOC105436902 isoform X1 [Strongylocentrotus purpuratus]
MAPVRGSYRRGYDQEAMENAIQRVKLGEVSTREASRLYKVPRATLMDKLANRVPLNCRSGPSPKLPIADEANCAKRVIRTRAMAPVRGSYRRGYDQEVMENAVQRVKLGEISMREASRLYKVPRATLMDKLANRVPLNCRSGPSPKLPIAEKGNSAEQGKKRKKTIKLANRVPLNCRSGPSPKLPIAEEANCAEQVIRTREMAPSPDLPIAEEVNCAEQVIRTGAMAPVRGSYRRGYDQEAMVNAVQRVSLGEISVREASRLYKVPRATLMDKLSYRVPLNCRSGPRPYLTMDEEANIAEWVIRMAKIGYGQTLSDLKQTVKKILDDDGRPTPFKDNLPGKKWMKEFQHRHPELVMRTPQLLGKERAVLSVEVISRWYNQLEDFLTCENAASILTEPGRMFNCDESRFVLGEGRNQNILAKKGEHDVTSVGNSDKRQITVLANMSSDGTYLPPLIVFPGVRLSPVVAEGAPEGSYIGGSPIGRMNSEVFFCYISNCFIPFVKQKGVNFPVLLLVDGDRSHLSFELNELCKVNKVILYCLPPNASHMIQPCSLSLFSSLKEKWAATESKYRMENEGAPVSKVMFAREFDKAWTEITCDPMVARNGFRAAGLFPFTKTCMGDKLLPATVFVRTPATQDKPAKAAAGQAPDAPPAPPAQPDAPPNTSIDAGGKSFVSPSLKHHLRFRPITVPPKKRETLKTKRQKKEEEQKNKIKRKEERKRKTTEKEEAKKKKKKKKTVRSADREEAIDKVYTCGDCGGVNSSAEISAKLITSTHGVDQGSTYSPVECHDCHAMVGKVYRTTPRLLDDLRDNYTLDANKLSIYQIGSATTTVSPADDAASSLLNMTDLKTLKETMLKLQVLMCTMHQRIANIEQSLEIEEIDPVGPTQDLIPQVLSPIPKQKQSNGNKDMGRVSQNTSMQLGSNISSSANSDGSGPKENVPSKKKSKRRGVDSRESVSLEERVKKRERSTKRLKKSGND